MSDRAAPLDLAPGPALVVDGAEWMVERLEPQYGRVLLVDSGGNRMPANIWTAAMMATTERSANASIPTPTGWPLASTPDSPAPQRVPADSQPL